MLGAGGTARAALAAARDLGRRPRSPCSPAGSRPIEELAPVADDLGLTLIGAGWADAAAAGDADVVISTVPRGRRRPARRRRSPGAPGAVLFDAIYDPWPTPLAASAAAAGCRIVSGLDLLLAQAVRQFELFTGVDAPVGPMRTALLLAAGP